MSDRSFTVEQILTLLAEAPQRMAEFTADLTEEQLHAGPNPGDWSANDVLSHLRSCADVWGNCIAEMLAHDTPTIRAINPRTWIKRTDYPTLEFRPSLHAFTRQRAELLAVLEPLPPEGWSRGAIVKGAGKVLDRTVFFYAHWLVLHERPHLKQIARIAKTTRV